MTTKKLGRQTVALAHPPSVAGHANVVGKKEGEGPLADSFDQINQDDSFGEKTWEKAETAMQKLALSSALDKAGLSASALDYILAGDLLNQCIGSGFAVRGQDVPFFGLYGACSTMGEGLALAAMTLDGGFGQRAGVVVSSHFCTAERQYRTPLEYGSQRTPTAQWTVTAAGAVLLSREGPGPYLTHVTPGRVVDKGVTDTNNMGAAMAPAAYDTIRAHLQDTGREPGFYDLIITGDLGQLGGELLRELFQQDGVDLSPPVRRLRPDDLRPGAAGRPLRRLRLRLLRSRPNGPSAPGDARRPVEQHPLLPHRGPPLPHHRLPGGVHSRDLPRHRPLQPPPRLLRPAAHLPL